MLCLAATPLAAQQYFQQKTDFVIRVTLDDQRHQLRAFMELTYTNNSPDTLKEICFLLYPNAYSNKHTEMSSQMKKLNDPSFAWGDATQRGKISGLEFKSGNQVLFHEAVGAHEDLCWLLPDRPLLPGDSIRITTPFVVDLPPAGISRLGHEGQAYYITQWYPKPAVYDQSGWHLYPYLDQGEFYYEYGTCDVFITLPENYVIAATGELVSNPREEAFISQRIRLTEERAPTYDDLNFPASSPDTKTLHFHQDRVHDFAWFADKRYFIRQSSVIIDGRSVTTRAYYTAEEGDLWEGATSYINDALDRYSEWVGPYPYNFCSAVQGPAAGGGMEYPMITLIGTMGNAALLEEVIMHEVGHNWFQGIIGSNERIHPWMDEGINSFYEMRYMQWKYPDRHLYEVFLPYRGLARFMGLENVPQSEMYRLAWEILKRNGTDMPADLPADEYPVMNYAGDVYMKAGLAFNALYLSKGPGLFDTAMQEYYRCWAFRHPRPEDLKLILQKHYGEDLSWLFEGYLTGESDDYRFSAAVRDQDSLSVQIRNRGRAGVPLSISLYRDENIISQIAIEGFTGKRRIRLPLDFDVAVMDAAHTTPDAYRKNNHLRGRGIFKRCEPLKLQFLGSIDDPRRTQLFFLPAIAYNVYDKFQTGVALYNTALFPKKAEWVVVPMYAFGSRSLTGLAQLNLRVHPDWSWLRQLQFRMAFQRFHWNDSPQMLDFRRASAALILNLRPRKPLSWLRHEILLQNTQVFRDQIVYRARPAGEGYDAVKTGQQYYLNELRYSISNARKPAPFSGNLSVQQGDHLLRLSAEGRLRIPYNARKGMDIRMFFGTFLWSDPSSPLDFRFRLSGDEGYQDIMYDHVFAGRSENKGMWSQQFAYKGGGFHYFTPLGQTWEWLWAVNIESPLPGRLPLRLYLDAGTYADAGRLPGTSEVFLYDAGIKVILLRGICELSFPLAASKDLQSVNRLYSKNYWQNIRFTLQLEKIRPWEMINRFLE